MPNRDSNEKAQFNFYKEIILKDCYRMREFENGAFDAILDIGANVGVFSVFAAMRHIGCKIYAYEPCKETFEHLVKNTIYIPTVECISEAFGDGERLLFKDESWSGCNMFFKQEEKPENKQTYSVESSSLSQMFERHNISMDSNYYIKMDCEGGERFLFDDDKAVDIIKNSKGSGIEIHFPPTSVNDAREDAKRRYANFPEWETYNEWMFDTFSKTHDVVYHYSNRRTGSGVYAMVGR